MNQDLIGLVENIVDYIARGAGAVLVAFFVVRFVNAYQADDDRKMWRSLFWFFVGIGLVATGTSIADVIEKTWKGFFGQGQ